MLPTAPIAPGIQGAAPVTALPNNGGAAPTVPVTIPATAPAGQTSTSAPASTPTAVVSSGTASDYVNNTIAPTLAAAKTAQATQQANTAATVAANPYSVLPGETTAAYNARVAAYNASKVVAPVEKTPEQQIADNPDTGNQWLYDSQGNKVQNPIGDPVPVGYSTTNPNVGPTTPVVDQTTDPVGNVYKQLSDGTYAKYNATGVYIGSATQSDFQNSKDGETALNSLTQLANGTFPLSANEQAQVDGIKASFQALIQQQQTANANLTGGTTVAENLYGMGTSLSGLGEIKGTVDSGLAKIADLNSKMSTAVAQMEEGFRNDDVAAIKAAYDEYSDTVKSRQSELDTIQAATQKALVDAQTAARENETLKLTKMMDDNTISYQTKQLALDQSSLDEKTKDDLATQQLNKLKYQLDVRKENVAEQGASDPTGLGGSPLPVVGYTASGAPDPAAQTQLLNSLPGGPNGDLATQIKGLANYTIDPTTFTVRTLKGGTQMTRDEMVALAARYNPSYDMKNYPAAAKYLASFKSTTPNSTGGQIAAANKGIVHFANFVDQVSSLDNKGISHVNAVFNDTTTDPARRATLKNANTTALAVSDELSKFFKGGTADVKSIDDWQNALDVNASPGDLQGLKDSTVNLLTGQLDVAYSNYESAMGVPPPAPGQPGSILTPAAITALKKIGVDTTPYDQGVQPYNTTSNDDFINSVPGNSNGGVTNTADFFNGL